MRNSKIDKYNIIPPYLLEYIANNCDENDKECALRTLEHVNSLMKNSAKEEKISQPENNLSIDKKKITKLDDLQ
ncbi:protealysin propeptide domain-containing protein [Xenorhabdus bovienii]|uniref:protealysin propeptide domain-containing protein n=1 Tax=Xenorhabdus bovienii TaxID=40576 RepID=UPI0023B34026|nr:protealysin propeptide domain-containing protein [Xenorhabdus bovienii]MDE9429466.1 hypothetical protein [Xenorhabdus bovienii]MDE9462335.1 hypothetical protein [Xenorhabdus bovienii]MDE9469157.1 hypothetical protein [Xenorhabdus bovienii]MDE9534451.1 hypothetical protein [Xenorhabdus bovienii]MDE9538032.1 hypothetical protein [Xenorhabdus bovienii]